MDRHEAQASDILATPPTTPWGCWKRGYVRFPFPHALPWRHGVVVAQAGHLQGVFGRWWAYQASYPESWLDQRFMWRSGNRSWAHYTFPRSTPGYMALRYLVSGKEATLSTVQAALKGLEQVANAHQALAIVCSLSNRRLEDRLMLRFGFERHAFRIPGHHFIKRLASRAKG